MSVTINNPFGAEGSIKVSGRYKFYAVSGSAKSRAIPYEAEMELKGKQGKKVIPTKWEMVRVIQLFFKVEYRLFKTDEFHGRKITIPLCEGYGGYQCFWAVSYGKNGVEIGKANLKELETKSDKRDKYSVTLDAKAKESSGGSAPSAEMTVMLGIESKDKGTSVTVAGQPLGVGISTQVEILARREQEMRYPFTLIIALDVKDRPKAEQPPPKTPVKLESEVYFKDEGQVTTDGIMPQLKEWMDDTFGKNEALLDVIRNGDVTLTLVGHASSSADEKTNKNVAKERIDAIERLLKRPAFLGSKLKVTSKNMGKTQARKGVRKPDPADRRVEILIDREQTIAALKKRLVQRK